MAMHDIDLDIAERKICCNFVDVIWMGGMPEKLKKVYYITVYRTKESEEYKEEVEGIVVVQNMPRNGYLSKNTDQKRPLGG